MARRVSRVLDPWRLVWGQPHIDSGALAEAIEDELQRNPALDYRTRLLVRDAARALHSFWGTTKFAHWLIASPAAQRIDAILNESFAETGFPHIGRRLVDVIGTIQFKQIFTLLGQRVHDRVEVNVAGSIPTLIEGLTARPTEDIDIVDEVPAEVRKQRSVLSKIQSDYGLSLGHVQSHDLPASWEQRRRFLGDFGGLRVYLVDSYDIFVSKLSSKKEKHKDDLRVLAQKLDRETGKRRLFDAGCAFLKYPHQRPQIEENWRFIYQEALAPPSATKIEETPEGQPARRSEKSRRKALV